MARSRSPVSTAGRAGRQQTRRGKGNALACGFDAATGDVIAMVDADGSADPGEIPAFVRGALCGADFAKGTRFAAGGGSSDITRLRKLGNRGLTPLFNLCYGARYSDLCYGYNVFWRSHSGTGPRHHRSCFRRATGGCGATDSRSRR